MQLLHARQQASLHLPEQAIDFLTTRAKRIDAIRISAGMAQIDQQIDLFVRETKQMLRADA